MSSYAPMTPVVHTALLITVPALVIYTALLGAAVWSRNGGDFELPSVDNSILDGLQVIPSATTSGSPTTLVLTRDNVTGAYAWMPDSAQDFGEGCMVRSHIADTTNRTIGAENVGVFTLLDFPGTAYSYSHCSNTTWAWRTGLFTIPTAGFYRISGRLRYEFLDKAFTVEIYRGTELLSRNAPLEGLLITEFDTFTWADTGDVLKIMHAPDASEEAEAGRLKANSYVFIQRQLFEAPVATTSAPTPAPTPAPSLGTLLPAWARYIVNSSLVLTWNASGTTTHGSLRQHLAGAANYTLVSDNVTLANGNYTLNLPTTAGNVTYTLLDHLGVSASTTVLVTAAPQYNITSPVASSNVTGGVAAIITWTADAVSTHYLLKISVRIAGNATYTQIATDVNATLQTQAGYNWVAMAGATYLRIAVVGYEATNYKEVLFNVV